MTRRLYLQIIILAGFFLSCHAQSTKSADLRIQYYKKEVAIAQDKVIYIDSNEIRFALWNNKDWGNGRIDSIKKIIPIPILDVADNCFVALDCNYSHANFMYCISQCEASYKEYFLCDEDEKWYHLVYMIDDPKNSYCTKQHYMQTDICEITSIVQYQEKNIVKIARNLCILKNDNIYTFKGGKLIPYNEYYSNWNAHKPHFIDSCTVPRK